MCGNELFSDALHFAISMSIKFKEESQVLPSFETLMDDDSIIINELAFITSRIKREVSWVLDSFFSFLTKYENKKTCYMISLILDVRFKSLCMVSSIVEREQSVNLVEVHDKESLYSMLVKCHEHLHPLIRSNRHHVD
jgi:hypothetical protein